MLERGGGLEGVENVGGQRADWRLDGGLESRKKARGRVESWRAKRRQEKGDKAKHLRAARKLESRE
jgi:hypothetical protein